ncbi:MAG: hypothetical protein KatS3mg012_1680 [Gaiellaceae bacterium]|nr:MAG: hypothetical protein KatS3mg012_1680 [Gaiellaceae bacterium]
MSGDHERLPGLVHEVRSPVAALAALAGALRDRTLDSAARARLVALALDACAAIDRLVRDGAVAPAASELVDVGRLARDVCAAAELVGQAAVTVSTPEAPVVVRADPIRLRQALDNLVRNALAVTPADGEVAVAVGGDRQSVWIAVSDSGPGIPERERERIFEPGVRLGSDRPGSGLGLPIARAIVEAHGGTVRVESSALGGGSTFVVTLPRPS